MALDIPSNANHSEQQNAVMKESHFMNVKQIKRWALVALLIAVFAVVGAQAQLSTASL